MDNSRLIQIIKSFDKKEWKAFSRFLHAGAITAKNKKELLKLFMFLDKHFPDFESKYLNKENVYQIIYNEDRVVLGKLDKLLTKFLKVTYDFIATFFSHEHCSSQAIICKFLQERNLESSFKRTFNKWGKQFVDLRFYDSDIMYERFLMKELLVIEQTKRNDPNIVEELPELLQNLDQYYIFTKVKYACQLLAINLFTTPVDMKDSLKSFEYLEKIIELPHVQLPVIQVYFQAYKMLNSEAGFRTESVDKFKVLLQKFDKDLSLTQKVPLHALIRNYAIFQYHNGQTIFLKYVFEIYKDHLEKGFLYQGNKILSQPCLNIVTSGLRLGKYKWVHQFLLDHKDRISGVEPSWLIFNFNMALYFFYTKNYRKALELLPDNFNNIYYKIGARRLELILYYETRLEILDAKIEAFKVFIYRLVRSETTQRQKVANKNFIHLLKQIRHPKTEVDKNRVEKLKSKIYNMEHIAEKHWLIDVLDRMN